MRELNSKEMEAVSGGTPGHLVIALVKHTEGVVKILTMHTGAMIGTILGLFFPKKP